MTATLLQISAKNLGEVALPDFCPRCFWYKLYVKRLPFQVFPGIFSSIDSYTKKVIHNWFDDTGVAPAWLASLGDFTGYYPPPHHSKFYFVDPETEIKLTGSPDGILIRADNSYVIVDYKTAKYTEAQDQLFPLYEAQLNGYALISDHVGPAPVSGLALVYLEPVTHDGAAKDAKNRLTTGLAMDFTAQIQKVLLNTRLVALLMQKARDIYDSPSAPIGRAGCKDCESIDALIAIAEPPGT